MSEPIRSADRQPIFLITGAPGAGKMTLARALLQRFEFGFHVPVDIIRTWVVSGLSESINWTDETTRQFEIAESAACDLALRYWEAGFAVAIDHCRNFARLEEIAQGLPDPVKIVLCPSLEVNLQRNEERTNKDFDPAVLEPIIIGMNPTMRVPAPEGWLAIDNSSLSVAETVELVLGSF